jgi:DNA-binding response OmpR family regulator
MQLVTSSMERVINILLVENDRIDQNAVKRELTKRKVLHRLYIAESSEQALKWMHESSLEVVNKPHLILLDLQTGGVNGFELLSYLNRHSEWRNCKVFILSVADDPLTRMKTSEFNIAGYIVKPLRLERPSSADELHLIIDLTNIQNYSTETNEIGMA